jgi:hypothetical protein
MPEFKSYFSKKVLVVLLPVVGIVVIYLALVYPWPVIKDIGGTMGGVDDGVQQAKKYRANQMKETDVLLKNPEFQKIIQTDEFQKLLKNEDFKKFASSGNLTKLSELGVIGLIANKDFNVCCTMQAFQNLTQNEIFKVVCMSPEFHKIVIDKSILTNYDKGNMGKVETNALVQNYIHSKEKSDKDFNFEGSFIRLVKSDDFKAVVLNKEFQALMGNPMFVACCKTGSLTAFPMGVAMQSINNAGFFNVCQQDIFKVFCTSKEFQDLACANRLDMLNIVIP